MIMCDLCQEWFHCECVGIALEDINQISSYVCIACAKRKKNLDSLLVQQMTMDKNQNER